MKQFQKLKLKEFHYDETMVEQIENKSHLKHVINAILQNKRILVYRNEIIGEVNNSHILLYNYNNDDFDIFTIPYVIERLKEEKEFISFLYETEKAGINILSNWIIDYIDYKTKSCKIKGYVYGELLKLMTMLNYKFSVDYSNFNKYMFSGEIKYTAIPDLEKTAIVTEKIEYCNHCENVNDTEVGIKKCLSYKLE